MARYPRFGQRLAPMALAEILERPCPPRLVGSEISQFPKLKDLDERVWHALSGDVCHQLADIVVQNVRWELSRPSSVIRLRHLPVPFGVTDFSALEIEVRTLQCLTKLKRLNKDMAGLTIGEFTKIAGCRAKILVDLLTCLEAVGSPQQGGADGPMAPASADLTAAARRLQAIQEASLIHADDPRLGHLIHAINSGASDVRDLADRLLRGTSERVADQEIVERVIDLENLIRRFAAFSLEAEMFSFVGDRPKGRMAARYFGLDGQGGATLQVVGDEFGVTRERIRQIVTPLASRLEGKVPFAPALDTAIRFVVEHTPGPAEDIEKQLLESGLTRGIFRLEGLIEAVKFLGRAPQFRITERNGKRIVHSEIRSADKIVQIARREISHYGISRIAYIAAHLREVEPELSDEALIAGVLAGEDGFQWLNRGAGWFWIASVPRNSLVNRIEKILSIANPIKVSELRSGIGRDYRMQWFFPPSSVLIGLCRQIPRFQVDDSSITAKPPIDPSEVLGKVEKTIVDVLAERGGIMRRRDLESICRRRKINQSSLYLLLAHSPVIAKYAVGVFGLIGADIAPDIVDGLAAKRRDRKVLADCIYGTGD